MKWPTHLQSVTSGPNLCFRGHKPKSLAPYVTYSWWRSRLTLRSHWLKMRCDTQLDEAEWPQLHSYWVKERGYHIVCVCVCVCISASKGSYKGGGGVSQKLAIALHPSPMLGTHMDSDRLEKEEGEKPKMEDGGMPACLPPGTLMILAACLLHPLCADPFKHYQLKTDPGLPQL